MRSNRYHYSSTPDHYSTGGSSFHSQSSNSISSKQSVQALRPDKQMLIIQSQPQQDQYTTRDSLYGKAFTALTPSQCLPPSGSVSMKLKTSMLIQQEADKNKENVTRLKERVEEVQKRVESLHSENSNTRHPSDILNAMVTKDFKQSYVVSRTSYSPPRASFTNNSNSRIFLAAEGDSEQLNQRKAGILRELKARVDLLKTLSTSGETKNQQFLSCAFLDEDNKEILAYLVKNMYYEFEKALLESVRTSQMVIAKMTELEKQLFDRTQQIRALEDEIIEKNLIISTQVSKLQRYSQRQEDIQWIFEESKRVLEEVAGQSDNEFEGGRFKGNQVIGLARELQRLRDAFEELRIGGVNGGDQSNQSTLQVGLARRQLEINEDSYLNENKQDSLNKQSRHNSVNNFTNQMNNYVKIGQLNSMKQSQVKKAGNQLGNTNKNTDMWSSSILREGSNKFKEIRQQIESLEDEYANIDSVQQSLEEQVNKYRQCFQEQLKLSQYLQKSMEMIEEENLQLKQQCSSLGNKQQYINDSSQIIKKEELERDLEKMCVQLRLTQKDKEKIEFELKELKDIQRQKGFEGQCQLDGVLNQKLETAERRVVSGEIKNQELQQQYNDIHKKLNVVERQKVEMEVLLRELQQQRNEQKGIRDQQIEQKSQQQEYKYQELQAEYNELKCKFQDLQLKYQDVFNKLNEYQKKIREFDEQLRKQQQEQQIEKSSSEQKIYSLEQVNAHLRKELDECLGLLESGKLNIEELKHQIVKKEQINIDYQRQTEDLRKQLNQAEDRIGEFQHGGMEKNKNAQQAVKCLVESQVQVLPQIEQLIFEENESGIDEDNNNNIRENRQVIQSLYSSSFINLVDRIKERVQVLLQQSKSLYLKLQLNCEGRIQAGEDLKVMGQMVLQAYEVLARHSHVQLPTPLMMLREELEMKRNAIEDKLQECVLEQQQVYEDFHAVSFLDDCKIEDEEGTADLEGRSSFMCAKQSIVEGRFSTIENNLNNNSNHNNKLDAETTLGMARNYESQQDKYNQSSMSLTNSISRMPKVSIVDNGRISDAVQSTRSIKRPSKSKKVDSDEYQSTQSASGYINNTRESSSNDILWEGNEEFLQLLFSQASSIEQLLQSQ